MLNKTLSILIIIFTSNFNAGFSQTNALSAMSKDTILFSQIETDSLYNSKQIISIIALNKNSKKYNIALEYSPIKLIRTSEFALKNNALAAINGGFFNVDKGGSVTYLEIEDTVISKNSSKKNKWGKPKNLMNGALILDKQNSILIEKAKNEDFYENSKNENAVLVTGPVLLLESKAMKMPNLKFVNKRHPRTCLCTTDKSILLITIDGRSKRAQGMNLYELQEYLKTLNCIDAINLDGGGSTTMWLKNKGIVNNPSDKAGERPVANALLVLPKDKNN